MWDPVLGSVVGAGQWVKRSLYTALALGELLLGALWPAVFMAPSGPTAH